MVRTGRPSRIEIAELYGENYPNLNKINMRWIFSKNEEEILKLLAQHRLIANKKRCPNVQSAKSTVSFPVCLHAI
jgi:hypothetical protein